MYASPRHTVLILALLACLPAAVSGQGFRPHELNVEYHRAHTAWSTGNSLLEAKARIDRVLSDLPEDVEALKLRASILLDMERPEDALRDAHRAARLAPDDGEAHVLRCEAAVLTDQHTDAGEALDAASNLFLERFEHYIRLSACALRMGAVTRAESLARVVVAQDASDPRGHIQLARVFAATDRPEAALSILQRLMAANKLSRSAVLADAQLSGLLM
jgi:predicted Zn-dependent protease